MTTIKAGFSDKPLHIRFDTYGSEDSQSVGLWIEQVGLNTGAERVIQRYETLSYATLGELIALRDELNKVIKEVVGI